MVRKDRSEARGTEDAALCVPSDVREKMEKIMTVISVVLGNTHACITAGVGYTTSDNSRLIFFPNAYAERERPSS